MDRPPATGNSRPWSPTGGKITPPRNRKICLFLPSMPFSPDAPQPPPHPPSLPPDDRGGMARPRHHPDRPPSPRPGPPHLPRRPPCPGPRPHPARPSAGPACSPARPTLAAARSGFVPNPRLRENSAFYRHLRHHRSVSPPAAGPRRPAPHRTAPPPAAPASHAPCAWSGPDPPPCPMPCATAMPAGRISPFCPAPSQFRATAPTLRWIRQHALPATGPGPERVEDRTTP